MEDPWRLKDAPSEIRNIKKIVIAAVKADGQTLEFASPSLRYDKHVVMTAVQENGYSIRYVSPSLEFPDSAIFGGAVGPESPWMDKKINLAAVKSNPDAIKWLHEDLKRDPEVLVAAGMFDEDHVDATSRQHASTIKIALSTRFALHESTSSEATNFTALFKSSEYYLGGDFTVYASNAFDKKTCDPQWTRFEHPCRGTKDTCQYVNNILTPDGRPTDDCCWRYSYRSQLQEAKDSGGFMLQLVETEPTKTHCERKGKDATLGNGQRIELDMATMMGVKVFQVYCPVDGYIGYEYEFEDHHIDFVTAEISRWYDSQCSDMTVTVIRQPYGPIMIVEYLVSSK